MESDAGSLCSICLGAYTIDGSHRVISLKCGHLFGSECIEKWMSTYKKSYCPTCATPFKKSQLRPIYAVKIVAHEKESEKEMIEKYIKETETRKLLENEVSRLKTQLDVIKSTNRAALVINNRITHQIHMSFVRYNKIHFFPEDNRMAFDPINQALLVTCTKQNEHGIFKYNISDFSIYTFIKVSDPVKSLVVSPFGDALCLFSCGNTITLMNIYSEVAIKNFAFENKITAVSFCKIYRNQVLAGDENGHFYTIDVITEKIERYKVAEECIHSLVEDGSFVYACTVFGVFKNSYLSLAHAFENEEAQTAGICTSLSVDDEGNVLALLRTQGFDLHVLVMGTRNYEFVPEAKQFAKHVDKFMNGYLLITDDEKNKIKVFDKNTMQLVYTYSFRERVIAYCGDDCLLAVLTAKGVYVYNSKENSVK